MSGRRLYLYRGEWMPLHILASHAKVPVGVLSYRLNQLHWPVKEAVETPRLTRSQSGRRAADAAAKQHLIPGNLGDVS